MALYSLGQVGEPRESDLADLSKYTGELAKSKQAAREKALDRTSQYETALSKAGWEEQAAQKKRAFDAAESHKARVADAQKIVKKDELDKNEATRKNLRDTIQVYSDKPEDQRKMFDTSEQGKQWKKLVKEYLPEAFDANTGEIVLLPSKPQEGGYKPANADEEVALKGRIESAVRQARSQGLTAQEAAAVGKMAADGVAMGLLDQDEAKVLMAMAKKSIRGAFEAGKQQPQSPYTSPLGQGSPGGTMTINDNQDPLGLLQ